MNSLPEIGYVRIRQIVGDPRATPPIPAIIPIGKSTWWEGVRAGRFPKPIKIGRTTCWRVSDIRAMVDQGQAGQTSSSTQRRV